MKRQKNVRLLVEIFCLAIVCGQWSSARLMADETSRSVKRSAAHAALAPGELDPKLSRVYIFVGKTGFGHEHAVVGKLKEGRIHLGGAEHAGKLVFDMAAFDADSQAARKYIGLAGTTSPSTRQQVNANMFGADVLNVQHYPTAVFQIQSALSIPDRSGRGASRYRLTGQFTLHGVKRPLMIEAQALQERERIHLRGAFSFRQTQFGITPFSKAFGAVGVADQLTVHGELYLVPDAPSAQSPPKPKS